jgi:hypothetical protein
MGFLTNVGIKSGIEAKRNPRGKGSGFDYVRNVFAEEVRAMTSYREGRGVLALMDEDGKGIENRRSWVNSHLEELKLPESDCAEGRCLVLTKRNVETWVYWLTGFRLGEEWGVSETGNYKTSRPAGASRRLENKDWREAGRKLHSIDHTSPPAGMPQELLFSLEKLREFVRAVRR